MFAFFQHRGWHYAALLAAGMGLFVLNLGLPSLWDRDEGCNAAAALGMLASGDFIVPYFNGELRPDKPALLYWLQAACFKTLGINEFAARFPSAVAAVLTLLLCYELGRSLFGKTTGLLAALMAGTTPLMCGTARFANPDALLNLCIVLTMFFYWRSQGAGARWFAAMGAASGLAVLAKGPIGLMPTVAIVVHCGWTRRMRDFFRPALALSALTFALVALPWYILVGVESKGRFLEGFFLDHNVNRFLTSMDQHSGSAFVYYPLALLLGTAPWSIFGGLFCWTARQRLNAWRAARRMGPVSHPPIDPSGGPALRRANLPSSFLLTWIAVFFLFFSAAATKLPNYMLPVLIPMALLAANVMVRWARGEIQPPVWISYSWMAALLAIWAGLGLGMLIASGRLPVSLLEGRAYPGLESAAVLSLLPLGVGVFGVWLLRRNQRAGVLWLMTLAGLAFMVPIAMWGSACFDSAKPPRLLVEQLPAQGMDRPVEVVCWNVEHLPSLNFYWRRDITHCETPEQLLTYLRYPSDIAVYLVLPAQKWAELKQHLAVPYRELGQHRDMYHNEDLVVIGNR